MRFVCILAALTGRGLKTFLGGNAVWSGTHEPTCCIYLQGRGWRQRVPQQHRYLPTWNKDITTHKTVKLQEDAVCSFLPNVGTY